jgi:hypothetical protein
MLFFVAPEYLVMLQIVKVDGTDADGHEIEVDVVPWAKGTGNPAPFPVTLPTLTVPAVRAP